MTDHSFCESCGNPLYHITLADGREQLLCINIKCSSGRLSRIEVRLASIERHLNITPAILDESVLVEKRKTEYELAVENIRKLPRVSIAEGARQFNALENHLGKGKLVKLLKNTISLFYDESPEKIRDWAILNAYADRAVPAAKSLLSSGVEEKHAIIREVLDRYNAISTSATQIRSQDFYFYLYKWAISQGLPAALRNELKELAGIATPPAISRKIKKTEEILAPPSLGADLDVPSTDHSKLPGELTVPAPLEKLIARFRPKEGWEFAIGANWLRWVGVATILLALFLLVAWSSQFVEPAQSTELVFIGLILSGVFLHVVSFILIKFKEKQRYYAPIGYSIAFLSQGIYFVAIFALRFEPSSPFAGIEYDVPHIILCIILVFSAVITAWRFDSSILYVEGYGFVLWLFWHVSSQLLVNDLDYPVNILFLGYTISVLAFLGIAFVRRDTVLTICIQLMTFLPLFLPYSSKVFSIHSLVPNFPEVNLAISLLFFIGIVYWLIAFKFPLNAPSQFFDIIKRDHLSLSSAIPVFASFFLLAFRSITGSVFIPFLVIFVIAYLGLAYDQEDLGLAFILILLTQLLWLISIGVMGDYYIFIPEINATMFVLLFLTFCFWLVALKFPSDVPTRFWDSINRAHLSLAAVGPVFMSFVLSWLNLITSSIFIIYLVLFCLLWSTNRNVTFNIPNTAFLNVSLFDFVVYSSATLFLVTILLQEFDDLIGIVLGLIAFPLLILVGQSISSIVHERDVQEFYAIVNCSYVSTVSLILMRRGFFAQLGDLLISTLPSWKSVFDLILPLGQQQGQSWAFISYIWIIIVTITSVGLFKSHMLSKVPRFILTVSMPIIMVFLLSAQTSTLVRLLYIVSGYIYVIILLFLFDPVTSTEGQPDYDELYTYISGVALLQIIGYSFYLEHFDGNITPIILVNFLLPFLVGISIVFRKRAHNLFDRYLISSLSIFTFLQIQPFLQNQQIAELQPSSSWIIEFAFLAFGLFYLWMRTFFGRERPLSASKPPSLLRSLFPELIPADKKQVTVNLFIFCTLGFINNTFISNPYFFDAHITTFLYLILDSLVIIPAYFALRLAGINSFVAKVNTLIIYATGMIPRLLLFITVYEIEFILLLVPGLILQLIGHGLLLKLSKSKLIPAFSTRSWQFERNGRKTWAQDSLRVMALMNPLGFYIYATLLVERITGYFHLTTAAATMVIVAMLLTGYFVLMTRLGMPPVVSDGGIFFSIIVAWFFTLDSLELIYFTTAVTAFLCIIYGFWVNKRNWRIMGIGIIGISFLYSALEISQLSDNLIRIIGFGILGVISTVIGYVYSKFAVRFTKIDSKRPEDGEKI